MVAPGRIVRNKIYFIMTNSRFRNSCISVKTYPGADIQSDHVLLVGTYKVGLKRVIPKKTQRYDFRKLTDPNIQQTVKNTRMKS